MTFQAYRGSATLITACVMTIAVIGMALLYSRGWRRLRKDCRGDLPAWRLESFLTGLCALWIPAGSPLMDLDHHLLLAHMAQHLLLMTVAAPLILLGSPAIAFSRGVPAHLIDSFQSLRFPAVLQLLFHRIRKLVTHPVFCWLAATTTVIGFHIPPIFDIAMRSQAGHDIEHLCFFVAGLLFWHPVFEAWRGAADRPQWFIPVYLFLATLPCDALSAFLTFCGRVIYPHYLQAHRIFDISTLADQESAGALMWVWVTFAYLAPAAMLAIRMLSPQRDARARSMG